MPSQRPSQKFVLISLFLLLTAPLLVSCELTENYLKHDRSGNMEQQDYRDALAPREPEIDENDGRMSGIPPLQQYVAQPDSNYKPMPLVSISVNQTVPVRDVIYEIAEQANYDVELDPRIRGSIIFSARNRPMDVVIDKIAEIAGLRYKFSDDSLRVEIDTPYHEIYKVNYLALKRTNKSSVSNDISVVSGEGSDTGSSFSAENESVIDFWAELEKNLEQIIASNRDSNRLATTTDPRVTVAADNPAPVDPIVMDDQGNIVNNGPNVQVQAPQAVLNVSSLPADANSAAVDPNAPDPYQARFSLNRQAGMVSVFAPERLQKKIAEYMVELKKSATSQVLIEAKILEVSLKDEFSAGIDWASVLGNRGAFGFGLAPGGAGLVRGILDVDDTVSSNATAFIGRGDFSVAVDAISRFGTVRGLASPRLTVLNNQSAVLNVAENVVYFEVDVEVTTGDAGAAVQSIDTNAKTVPEGVLINVQPAIDLETGTVSMAIRPTITTITGFTDDPNPALALAGVRSPVPNVNVQEFDSIIQMNNGQAVVMGGLIQDRAVSTRNSVPVLGEVPIFGGMFRNQKDSVEKTELVVFLRATIVEGANTIHNTDKDLYRQFSDDRRPLRF